MKLQNEFLNIYLEYVEETESPRLFHIWSALSGVASCLGRRIHLPFGDDVIFPNLYTLLVGPPAVKKSSAMGRVKSLLKSSTSIRFSPDDTAGKHQGLLVAMIGNRDKEAEELFEEIERINATTGASLNGSDVLNKITSFDLSPKDAEVMCVMADEFTSFIGTNNTEMLTFLTRMWQGGDYKYSLTSKELILKEPLLNIIGCTTPTALAKALPVEAVGQGFMSRVIMVYSYTKYKRIPRPAVTNTELKKTIGDLYRILYETWEGEFALTDDAWELYDEHLYDKQLKFNDPRFLHYKDRRHIHLLKLSCLLAASKLSKKVEVQDLKEADFILEITESGMPEALGEYGLSPLAHAKQRLLDLIKSSKMPISKDALYAFMHRDMTASNFQISLAELTNSGAIREVHTNQGPAYMENMAKKIKEDDLLRAFLSVGSRDKVEEGGNDNDVH